MRLVYENFPYVNGENLAFLPEVGVLVHFDQESASTAHPLRVERRNFEVCFVMPS